MLRLAIRVRAEHAELVLQELLALVPAGVEEVEDAEAGVVEYAVYGAAGELPDVGVVQASAVGGHVVEVRTSEVADDWADRWRRFHHAVRVRGRRAGVDVRPPWEPPRTGADAPDVDLVVDPGQAFGTGGHDTTRLCLELLCGLEPGGPLADWGCGSGVLAIAAAKLGWAPVLGVDHEAESVRATLENARVNGVAGLVRAERQDLRRTTAPWAPTVTANLVRPLLLEVAALVERAPERLILSGLLREEGDEVAQAFGRHDLRETARVQGGDWCALLLERRA